MSNFKDCLYAINDSCKDISVGTDDKKNAPKPVYRKYPVKDIRVFDKDYTSIEYADGYLLTDVKDGVKGKILNFISNGIGDWRSKIKKIQAQLTSVDIAYFVVPEIGSIIVVTKENDMPITSASRAYEMIAGEAKEIASMEAKDEMNSIIDNIKNNLRVNVSLVATSKNKTIDLETVTFGDNKFVTYQVPEELKCGDYQIKVKFNSDNKDG